MDCLRKCTNDDGYYKEGLPTVFLQEFEQIFLTRMKTDVSFIEEFLIGLCKEKVAKKVKRSGEALRLVKKLVSMKVPFERALEESKRSGSMEIFEYLLFCGMGEALKGSVLKERQRVENLKGFASSFMNAHRCLEKDSKGHEFMEEMTRFMEVSFEKKLPISEDILFLTFRWSAIRCDGKIMESSIWKSLAKVLTEVLSIPMKEIEWEWFKSNFFHSAV